MSLKAIPFISLFFFVLFFLSIFALAIPQYSLNSTNSTTAGEPVSFNLRWDDSIGLSGYVFSFDNCTGSFENDTFVFWSFDSKYNQSKTFVISGVNLTSDESVLNFLGEGLTYDVKEKSLDFEKPFELLRNATGYVEIGISNWNNPEGGYTSDNNYANTSFDDAIVIYRDYNFEIPSNAVITSIFVGYEAHTDVNERIGITLSWNGGTRWTTEYVSDNLPTEDPNNITWVNFTEATHWTPDGLNNTNFRVRVRAIRAGPMSTVYLDWLPVNVTYVIPPAYEAEVWHDSLPIGYADLTSISVTLNFTSDANDTYIMQIYNWATSSWVQDGCDFGPVYANTSAKWWCNITSNLFQYKSSDNKIRVRIKSVADSDQGILKEDFVQYYVSYKPATAWSNVTKVINSTVGCEIRWKVYANDSNNNWNASEEFGFITTSKPYCGDGNCDVGEDCSCSDCKCPGSPGCCGSSCGCPPGQVCENDVCKTPSYPPPPGCNPRADWTCCVNKYIQCCDCPSLGYTACGYRSFDQKYEDCKELCMKECPGGCSVFNSSSSCLNAGCKWCNGICQESPCAINCSDFVDSSSCVNANCKWCNGRCKEECLINWTLTITPYLETFINEQVNGTIEIKNEGEVTLHKVMLHFINISPEIKYKVSPNSYSKIPPGESKGFVVTYTPTKNGTYDLIINITSDELYHLASITLVAKEPLKLPPELSVMMILLWVIASLTIVLTVASYKLFMKKKEIRKPRIVIKPKKIRKSRK